MSKDGIDSEIYTEALKYHEYSAQGNLNPGKLSVVPTKATETQKDLSLAYTPGVAEPVRQIHQNPESVYRYTTKGNLVAVITNGTAVLGLGNVGPLAAKPVMEGKAVLFKRFADVDVFDIEVAADNPEDFINTVMRIAPTFGGINLEDIKAPECFAIEEALIKLLDIPVFHDDQHGTAIVVAAALLNALHLQEKRIEEIRLVCLGAGAAGIATIKLLITLGLKKENLIFVDKEGVLHRNRTNLNIYKQEFAVADPAINTLADAMRGSDVFIGVSGPGLLDADLLKLMNHKPIVFALSNPEPELRPELAYKIREDLIMATGRSDYPNQVNNVLCFPYLFKGALQVRARALNEAMFIAAVHAIKDLAREPAPAEVLKAYGNTEFTFGPQYILPKPMDPRLKERVTAAVAQAAIKSGVTDK
jgi:malic enzyme